ncbi:hypothetical protein CKO12_08235 [Chromatium okenii]|uniref:DUF2802 domain-containing protein n=1 Tax=Chromatium okenii TaxID=61644 RepID=UPI001906BE0C|nr:DUF2802 domain-containing protein [Chromatium okenii]MBK1641857.1 hypothetical protein [Chromatium okenii]
MSFYEIPLYGWGVLLLTILTLIIAIRALIATAALRTQLRELKNDFHRYNTSLLALNGAMKVIAEDVITHGRMQSTVKRTLERLTDEHSEMRLREVDAGLYPQAIQLIYEGRRREEVRKLCGLTESEVDLLFSLHGQGTTDPSMSRFEPYQ